METEKREKAQLQLAVGHASLKDALIASKQLQTRK